MRIFTSLSTRNVQKVQVAHGRQDSDKIATVLLGHFQCTRTRYRRNAAGKPPADTPLPTPRANGDARQCDGANGLKGKMPSWGMVLPYSPCPESRRSTAAANGKDRGNGRVFTLLHEFCHLALWPLAR